MSGKSARSRSIDCECGCSRLSAQSKNSPTVSEQHDDRFVDEEYAGSTSIGEVEAKDANDRTSDVYTIPHSCLIGAPRKSQQLAVLVCGFIAIFQTFGLTQAYGIFQSFHTQNIGASKAMLPDEHASQRANIALVGTLGGAGLGYLLGVFVTPALKSRRTIPWKLGEWSNVSVLAASGSVLLFLGYLGASFSCKIEHLFLTQGVIVGIGGSLLCYPIVTICPEYFSKRQALAMGLITAGSGLGGMFYAPILGLLTQNIGIRWTLRILAFVNLFIGLALAAITPPARKTAHKRRFLPAKLLKDPILYFMVVAGLTNATGLNSPLAFGPDFGRLIGFDTKTCAIILSLINAVGSPARLILGFIGDAYGRQNMQILTTAISFSCVFTLWLVAAKEHIKGLWWAFTILYGSLGGGWGLFLSPVVIEVFGSDVFFGVVAIVNMARGVGSLVGPPVGGAILGSPNKGSDETERFVSLAVFTGVLLFIGMSCAVAVRVLHGRRNGWSWRA